MNRPYCAVCDKNREPILAVLTKLFADRKSVLEIGSGTGQHAVYFSRHLPQLTWHTSDIAGNLDDIKIWVDEANLSNIKLPVELDVTQETWPEIEVDAVFSANTVHIMHRHEVESFIRGTGRLLPAGGLFALYGPFNYGNEYTSESNERFDGWLKQRDPESGIRNFEDLDVTANSVKMVLKEDFEMPANNRILCWQKTGGN